MIACGGGDQPWLGGRPKVTIRWVGKPTWILFPPRALPIEKEIKLKTTEIGSLTEMVRPHVCLSCTIEKKSVFKGSRLIGKHSFRAFIQCGMSSVYRT